MPEKPLGVATYAAGASLAAIALVYVFAPTYFLDDNTPSSGGLFSSRKPGVVGLANPANDCFINAVLQALAGLGDLRLYLIRETHRRNIDEKWVYAQAVPEDAENGATEGDVVRSPRNAMPVWKVEGLQVGIATKGLKDMLDQLNERPIFKKTISAMPFVKVLEAAFRQRISRTQQDAQEFLQVVAERICDEYHAGRDARRYAKKKSGDAAVNGLALPTNEKLIDEKLARISSAENGVEVPPPTEQVEQLSVTTAPVVQDEEEEGFPMEGKFESQVECLTCHFKPKPAQQSFCTLTLSPTTSSTTLNNCFDGFFKIEFIDDFKCEKCRLVWARKQLEMDLAKSNSDTFKTKTAATIARLTTVIETDPENPPKDLPLPDFRYAPTTRISRHTRITHFPKILAIHLSRSIYDASHQSQKNTSKVSFPERLPLGSLLQQRKYRLAATVTHKGSHQSGHYESFRRQNVKAPFSNPNTFQQSPMYSRSGSPATTPRLNARLRTGSTESSPLASSPDLLSPVHGNGSSPSLASSLPSRGASIRRDVASSPAKRESPTSAPRDPPVKEKDSDTSSLKSFARTTLSKLGSSSRPGSRSGSRADTPTTQQNSAEDAPSAPANGVEVAADAGSLAPAEPQPKVQPPSPKAKRKKLLPSEKWWRISDEKVKEAGTREVLGMQREVYLLFYELER